MKIINNQGFSKIWIIIILATVVSGGVLAWHYSGILNVQNDNDNEMDKINEKISEEEAADWKTYRDEKYGFELKHPKKLFTKERFSASQPKEDCVLLKEILIDDEEGNYHDNQIINIRVYNNLPNYQLSEWLENKQDTSERGCGVLYTEYTINPITVSGIDGLTGDVPCRCGNFLNSVFLPKGDKIYSIGLLGELKTDEYYKDIFDTMLSTFKFSENAFENEKSYIEILSPNGGEQWVVGETYDITWASSGIEKVSIEIMGSGHAKILAIVDSDDEKFAWTIPASYAFNADSINEKPRLKISIFKFSGRSDISDVSDDYFSVIKK